MNGPLRRSMMFCLPFVTLFLSTVAAAADAGDRPPNVVLILVDDMGWSDLSIQGSEFYETPNIDALMRRGVRFTQAYSASPLCSPTRASILTGRHPARIGITAPRGHHERVNFDKRLLPGQAKLPWLESDSVTRLNTDYETLPERFRDAGYATGHFGKWHLGRRPFTPREHGYDVDRPGWHGPGPRPHYLAPWDFGSDGTLPDKGREGEHIDDRMVDEAIRFIDGVGDQPFFVSYWSFGVHSPWDQHRDVPPELLAKYERKAAGRPDDTGQRHPVMGGMIEKLDQTVGRLIDHLDDRGLADQTVIVFYSDNGGVHWRGPKKYGFADRPITDNAPLRGGKATIYEGGVRVPASVTWPGHVAAGETIDTPIVSTDLYPTLLSVANLDPAVVDAPIDGVDVSPLWNDGAIDDRPMFIHFPHGHGDRPGYQPASSLRVGDWKLIRFYADQYRPRAEIDRRRRWRFDRYELYDLATDIGESRDLSAEHPDRVRAMRRTMTEYLRQYDAVVPGPNRKFTGRMVGQPRVETFDGWVTKKHTRAEVVDGVLRIDCVGSDPYLVNTSLPPLEGPHTVRLRIKSDVGGTGRVYFKTTESDDLKSQNVTFVTPADDRWHDVEVALRFDAPMTFLRIDPFDATGRVSVDRIGIRDESNTTVAAANF